jgi:hypothetical protein
VELLAFYQATVFHSTGTLTTLESISYTPLDGTSGAYALPGGLVGDGGTNTMPAEVAEVLTIRTALRGRRHRGRVFLPAFVKDDFDGAGHISATALARVVAGVYALQAAAVIASWSFGVASYGVSVQVDHTVHPARKVVTTWPPEFTDVQSFTMDPSADVQRSRKR